MNSNFMINLPKDFELYKAIKSQENLESKLKNICWFALDIETGLRYMNDYVKNDDVDLYKFKTKENLNLIDILDLNFKLDFWNKCNKKYKADSPIKINALVSLGILNLETQEICTRKTNCDNQVKIFGDALCGHRCSSPNTDRYLAEALINIYGNKYDGYILPNDVYSCFHGIFPKELCLFDAYSKITNITKIESKKKNLVGGVYTNLRYWIDREEEIIQNLENKDENVYNEDLETIAQKNKEYIKKYCKLGKTIKFKN